jgi:hypothetical protein
MTTRVVLQVALLNLVPAFAQTLTQSGGRLGPVRLLPSDITVLKAEDRRLDLPCTVKPIIPTLGFDFNFHLGYEALIPFHQLTRTDSLTVVVRITPESASRENADKKAMYFLQRRLFQSANRAVTGDAQVRGGFQSGSGKYQIDWLIRDDSERFCSAHWQVSAETRGKDREVGLRLNSGAVIPEKTELFDNEPPVQRQGTRDLKVLVLVHVAPQVSGASHMKFEETALLTSIVRSIAREPNIGAYSIAAFNLERNEILYRATSSPQIDFQALAEGVKRLEFNVMDARSLRDRAPGSGVLGDLLAAEVEKNHPDAVIFVGPKMTENSWSAHRVSKEQGAPRCPIFYLHYSADPTLILSKDPIVSAVKVYKGFEYTIRKPHDLFTAWSKVMSHISVDRTGTTLVSKN